MPGRGSDTKPQHQVRNEAEAAPRTRRGTDLSRWARVDDIADGIYQSSFLDKAQSGSRITGHEILWRVVAARVRARLVG